MKTLVLICVTLTGMSALTPVKVTSGCPLPASVPSIVNSDSSPTRAPANPCPLSTTVAHSEVNELSHTIAVLGVCGKSISQKYINI